MAQHMTTGDISAHILFNEDPDVIRRLDEQATREGTTRAALIRRAIRRELSLLPATSTNEKVRDEEVAAQAA